MILASVRRLLATRRCAWLLAWTLCLPLAQVATMAHALQHLRAVAAEERDAPAQLPLAACDLCLAAAAIGGAAPLPAAPVQVPTAPPHAQPEAPAAEAPLVAPPSFYASRAPPLLHA